MLGLVIPASYPPFDCSTCRASVVGLRALLGAGQLQLLLQRLGDQLPEAGVAV